MAIPSLSNSPTKERIIEILSNEWPLTAKKIYRRVSKNISITYQAAHKALQELVEKGILEKTSKGYMMSKIWIESLSDFSSKIKERMESNLKIKDAQSSQKFVFAKHRDFLKFHIDFLTNLASKNPKVQMTFHFRHTPYPNVLTHEEIEKLKPYFKKIRWKIYAQSNSPLDKWCANQWKKMHVNVKLGARQTSKDMLIVTNEYIMYIYIPQKAINAWDKIFSIKSLHNIDLNAMTQTLLSQKFKTTVLLIKDKELANMLHE